MEHLSLEDEEQELEVQIERDQSKGVNPSLCLVGRFLTDRRTRVHMMKERMAAVWHPGRGVSIKEVEPGIFRFHQINIKRVLKQGPWSFDNHLLVLGVMQEGVTPSQVPLFTVPFWVQVHNVPVGFMSEMVGKHIANFIGEYLEYDTSNNSNFWKTYMRIRVLLDVRKPLKRMKKIKKPGGETKEVRFKYERWGPFCYLCGLLGHIKGFCDQHFLMKRDDREYTRGPELRAVPKRGAGGGGARWLREEGQTTWTSPILGTVMLYIANIMKSKVLR